MRSGNLVKPIFDQYRVDLSLSDQDFGINCGIDVAAAYDKANFSPNESFAIHKDRS